MPQNRFLTSYSPKADSSGELGLYKELSTGNGINQFNA